jgi:hypothetical protein
MAAKLPKSVARIPIPLYGGTVWFAQSIVDTQICASLLGAEAPPDGCDGLCYEWHSYMGKRILLVLAPPTDVPTLAHEISHATFKILGYVGVPVENDAANEAFCYLMGYLMQEALNQLKA